MKRIAAALAVLVILGTFASYRAIGAACGETAFNPFTRKLDCLGTAGGGSVTSIGIVAPSEFTVSGSPVTTSGNITLTKANQSANLVYAGPASGAAAAPTFRSLVAADIPAGCLAFDKTSATTWTITNGDHGFGTADLTVSIRRDDGTSYIPLNPDEVAIHKTTFAVTITFTVAQAGRALVCKAGGGSGWTVVSSALDFPSVSAGTCATELTFTATGAAAGRPVAPGLPALNLGLLGQMRISAANTVSVTLCNVTGGAIDPASLTFYAAF